MPEKGLEPVDVSPYVEGTALRYAALWTEPVARPLVGRDNTPARRV
jgi:hypothetical protein